MALDSFGGSRKDSNSHADAYDAIAAHAPVARRAKLT
jgi:hypothetical protein